VKHDPVARNLAKDAELRTTLFDERAKRKSENAPCVCKIPFQTKTKNYAMQLVETRLNEYKNEQNICRITKLFQIIKHN